MEDGLLRKKKKKKVWRSEIAAEMTKGDEAVAVFMKLVEAWYYFQLCSEEMGVGNYCRKETARAGSTVKKQEF